MATHSILNAGETFLSIGTGPGIGLATAERFAKEGYQIVLAARTAERIGKLADDLKKQGVKVSTATVDASNSRSLADLISQTEKSSGPIDTIHYNAAAIHTTGIDSLDDAGFQNDLQVNILGAYSVIRAALPGMVKSEQGTILLTGGGLALQPSYEYFSLSVGKAGIRALALGLFGELKKRGVHIATVTVNAYVPPGSDGVYAVAGEFLKLRNQERGSWTPEATFPL